MFLRPSLHLLLPENLGVALLFLLHSRFRQHLVDGSVLTACSRVAMVVCAGETESGGGGGGGGGALNMPQV